MIKSIGRVIGKFGDITLKTFVIFNDDKSNNKYHSNPAFKKWISYGMDQSLIYEFVTFIQLDYNRPYTQYDRNKRFNAQISQIWRLLDFLENTLYIIKKYGNEIFFIDSDNGGRLSMYNIDREHIEKYRNFSYGYLSNRTIESIPAIVYDYQENAYEGYRLYFNNHDNYVDVSYDELSSLYYILKKTDFVNLSQNMINSTILWYPKDINKDLNMVTESAASSNGNKNFVSSTKESTVIENQLPFTKSNNIFEGLKEKKG